MRVLCIGLNTDVLEMVTVAVRLRWPDAHIFEEKSSRRGLDLIEAETPDLVLLSGARSDLSLMETIQELRRFSEVPLMVWEHDGGELEVVKALELGADDYIRPPHGFIELVARMVALMRRLQPAPNTSNSPTITSGDLVVHSKTYEAFLGDTRLNLTPTEFRLLYILMSNRSAVVSHRFLERLLWGDRYDAGSLLKKYIQRLRKKLEDDPMDPIWISTLRGVGYRFIGPAEGARAPVAVASIATIL